MCLTIIMLRLNITNYPFIWNGKPYLVGKNYSHLYRDIILYDSSHDAIGIIHPLWSFLNQIMRKFF